MARGHQSNQKTAGNGAECVSCENRAGEGEIE
jgi:hypothetical protein